MTQSRFSYRVLNSFFVTFDLLILLVTGVVLYVVPHGRVAYWTNWELMGLSKDQWTSVHILSALLFLLVSILHLIFNWKPFKHYFYHKLQGVHRLRELSLALLISGFFFYSGVSSVKPLANDLNTALKILKHSKRSGNVFMIAENSQYWPEVNYVHDLL